MYSILHISDLHRSRAEPVDNTALLAALLADCDRYVLESPAVPPPSAVVVSGDIIQGALLGAANWQADIRDQYDVAEDFLGALADRFLEGDRSQLVLVPGNHDVCWNTSFAAMEEVTSPPKDIYASLREPGSNLRWSWKELKLYRITNQGLYERRLEAYWDFIDRFYRDASLTWPVTRASGSSFFELDGGKIGLAAFSSVCGNDCFAYNGAVADHAIGNSVLGLRDRGKVYDLLIAVWHHSVQGPPNNTDYMDVERIHELTGHGFRLGLHGHQHVAAAAAHYIHIPEQQAMAVVSAGSLCAGARELPRGANRQYNVIVISDDYRSARVHARELADGGHFGRKNNGQFTGGGYITVQWEAPVDFGGRPVDAEENRVREGSELAEAALRGGDADGALEFLRAVQLSSDSYARALFFEAANAARDWQSLTTRGYPPESAEELVVIVNAFLEQGEVARAEEAMTSADRLELPKPLQRDLLERISTYRMMRSI